VSAAGVAATGGQEHARVAAPTAVRGARAILLVACVAQFVLIVDDTIVNVALPSIGTDLGVATRDLSWVVNAYLLTFGGLLLVGGRIADRVGPRRVFLAALVAFTAASAACGAASSSEVLIGARAVQGMAAALLSPAALALVLRAYPDGPGRTRALATWASLIGVGAASGLLVGGALTELLSWRFIFYVNLPVALVALLAARRVVPRDPVRPTGGATGLRSAVLGTTAVLLLVFTVVEIDAVGWGDVRTIAGLLGALALGALFAWSESRSRQPLIPVAVRRRRTAMLADGIVLIAAAGLLAMFFLQTLFMQRVLGFGALEAGLGFLPFSVGMGLASVAAGRLPGGRVRLSATGGLVVGAVGLLAMSRLGADSSYAGQVAPALALTGLGVGTAFVTAMAIATGRAGPDDGGSASALLTTAQQVGGALGIAIAITVAADRTAADAARAVAPTEALANGLGAAFVVGAACMLAAGILALALPRRSRHAGGGSSRS
jgi:EmrB/QacA subfamily drug resistance transporter